MQKACVNVNKLTDITTTWHMKASGKSLTWQILMPRFLPCDGNRAERNMQGLYGISGMNDYIILRQN